MFLAIIVVQLIVMGIRDRRLFVDDPRFFLGLAGIYLIVFVGVSIVAFRKIGKADRMFQLELNEDGILFPKLEGNVLATRADVVRIEETKDALELVRRKGLTRLLIPKEIEGFAELREVVADWTTIGPKPRFYWLSDLAKGALFFLAAALFLFKNLALACVGFIGLLGLFYWFRHDIFVDTGVPPETGRNFVAIVVGVMMLGMGLFICGQLYDVLFIQPR